MTGAVSGSLKVEWQVVLWQLWRRAAAAGGAFYSAKRWGGNCPLCPPYSYAPDIYVPAVNENTYFL